MDGKERCAQLTWMSVLAAPVRTEELVIIYRTVITVFVSQDGQESTVRHKLMNVTVIHVSMGEHVMIFSIVTFVYAKMDLLVLIVQRTLMNVQVYLVRTMVSVTTSKGLICAPVGQGLLASTVS